MIMKCKILIYFIFASYVAVCGERIRSVNLKKSAGLEQLKLHGNHKYWRTSNNLKGANLDLVPRQQRPSHMKLMTAFRKPKHEETEYYRSRMAYDKPNQNVVSNNNNIRNKLRVEHKRVRPVGDQNYPRIKYIARNQQPDSTVLPMKGPQDRGGEIYGNLDNLGITYDKTNQRLSYSVNRKNSPLFRSKKTKRALPYRARKNNLEETRSDLDQASHLGEGLPTNYKNSSDNELQDFSPNEVGRNVEPFEDTPKSAASYPNAQESLVYGNLANLGISYGKTNQRILYSQSRRNSILESLLRLLSQPSRSQNRWNGQPLVVLFYRSPNRKVKTIDPSLYARVKQRAVSRDRDDFPMLSRTRRHNNESDSEENNDSASSDFEFNVQNPFTVHKNRYLQNYLWNHKLTGDHLNVNPYAPRFISDGATAPELFYSRKWWYFNQDDFIPFG